MAALADLKSDRNAGLAGLKLAGALAVYVAAAAGVFFAAMAAPWPGLIAKAVGMLILLAVLKAVPAGVVLLPFRPVNAGACFGLAVLAAALFDLAMVLARHPVSTVFERFARWDEDAHSLVVILVANAVWIAVIFVAMGGFGVKMDRSVR